MTAFRVTLVGGLCALLLSACGGGMHKGFVNDKRHIPPHVESYTYYVMVGKVLLPFTSNRDVSDTWQLQLRDCEGSKCKSGWLAVAKYVYTDAKHGDFFDSAQPYTSKSGSLPPMTCVWAGDHESCDVDQLAFASSERR